jgi:hemoglobin
MEKCNMSTLYERVGGADAVNAAVDLFYRKVLADGRIARFFDNVNMEDQIAKQKSFLTMDLVAPTITPARICATATRNLSKRV